MMFLLKLLLYGLPIESKSEHILAQMILVVKLRRANRCDVPCTTLSWQSFFRRIKDIMVHIQTFYTDRES